jgi:hypothetical protein
MTSTDQQNSTGTTVGALMEERGEDQARTAHDGHEHGIHMHTAHASLPIPYFTPGDLGANAKAATSKLPSLTSQLPGLPPPRRLAFYGGLGALVATGLVDLPVAAAIGVATIVARGTRGEEQRSQEQRPPEQRSQEQPIQAEQPAQAQSPQPSGQTG